MTSDFWWWLRGRHAIPDESASQPRSVNGQKAIEAPLCEDSVGPWKDMKSALYP